MRFHHPHSLSLIKLKFVSDSILLELFNIHNKLNEKEPPKKEVLEDLRLLTDYSSGSTTGFGSSKPKILTLFASNSSLEIIP